MVNRTTAENFAGRFFDISNYNIYNNKMIHESQDIFDSYIAIINIEN